MATANFISINHEGFLLLRYRGVGAAEKAAEARRQRQLEVQTAQLEQAGRYAGLSASELRELLVGRTGTG